MIVLYEEMSNNSEKYDRRFRPMKTPDSRVTRELHSKWSGN